MGLTAPETFLRLCPDCGSPSVSYSSLEGGEATCSCGWKGGKDKLLVTPIVHQMGSNEEILAQLYRDWRNVFSKEATDIARLLVRWGFLIMRKSGGKMKINKKELARYLSAAAAASLASILEERKTIEQERSRGN